MVVMLREEEMKKLFEYVGGVNTADSYTKAMDKVEPGIKRLTNQATARFKLFQEMPQDGRASAGGGAGQQMRLNQLRQVHGSP